MNAASLSGTSAAKAAANLPRSRNGYHGEAPEQPSCGVRELLVRHAERMGDLEIAGRELVQPALLVRQPGGELGGIPFGPAHQPVPDDPQRQRQTPAQLGKPGEGRLLGGRGTFAQNPRQQFQGLRHRQGPEDESADALQSCQQPPGGDQCPARSTSLQQWAHLLFRRGVVEDDQDPLVP
jgi:hypothetical protein